MQLGSLLNSVPKKYNKISVKGICFDSRKIKKNQIFFAIKGKKNSGINYIKEAVFKGASAIIINKKNRLINNKTKIIKVENVRESLSEACKNFFQKKPKSIIAVTGTNGKSSVANFFLQILELNKIPVASIGTLGIYSKKHKKKTNLTSIDPISLHKHLQILARKNINNIILEASSHGLDQNRIDGLKIKTGIFTNLSHDHLDYHKNMKIYLYSKMKLFKNLMEKNSFAITDEDNKEFNTIKKILKKRNINKLTIGKNSGNIKILQIKYKGNKQIVKISYNSKIYSIKISLIGSFQIKNLLMAILAAKTCGLKISKILKQINKIKSVPGRLECVSNLQNNSHIIVDFAHTPDALNQSLVALKNQYKKEILIVLGCGGERDKKKRIKMGRIAKKYCKKIFVTDDNPRYEDPKKIRKAIIKGCGKLAVNIGSRKKAIKTAINELDSNEILLVTGKGHENTQDYGQKVFNFSDKKVIKEIIKKKFFGKKKNNYRGFLLEKAFKDKKLNKANYNNVSINSKDIKKNDLFFAIKGKKNDGHNFVSQAIKKGAIKSIISKNVESLSSNKLIKVKDTFLSLNNLAKITREKTSANIIGITGSVGKTTLKNLVGFSLKNYGKVYYSPHSYNNKYGVPLSLSNLKENTEYGIFEIGMDKKGEINNLSNIVKPEVAVITNISGAHFKNFNTLKDIAKAKAEIIDNIIEGGTLVLNKDDRFFNFFNSLAKKRNLKVISFSNYKPADVYLINIKKIKKNYQLKVNIKNKIFYFNIKYSMNNFIYNVLACISVLFSLNLELVKMKKNFVNFNIPKGRGDIKIVKKFNKKFRFIDESYNANPLSMSSAINNMRYYKRRNSSQKLAFLGDMLELGKKSKKLHKELSAIINKSDVDKVFVYGNYIKETFKSLSKNKKGKIFNSLNEAHNHFSKIIHNNDLLMVKGSNATGLNQFSKNIKRIN